MAMVLARALAGHTQTRSVSRSLSDLLFVSYIVVVRVKASKAGRYQRVATAQSPAISVLVFAFLSVAGVPSPSPSRAFILVPPLNQV